MKRHKDLLICFLLDVLEVLHLDLWSILELLLKIWYKVRVEINFIVYRWPTVPILLAKTTFSTELPWNFWQKLIKN